MSDIVSWWSACCAFTVMLLLGTVLLGRILAAARVVAKAVCSSGPAKVIIDIARRGWDCCELSSTLKVAGTSTSQVNPSLFLLYNQANLGYNTFLPSQIPYRPFCFRSSLHQITLSILSSAPRPYCSSNFPRLSDQTENPPLSRRPIPVLPSHV